MENEIIKILNGFAETDRSITIQTDLLEEGILDSLGIANTIVALQEQFSIEISPEDIIPENFCNVCAVVSMVKKYLHDN